MSRTDQLRRTRNRLFKEYPYCRRWDNVRGKFVREDP